MIDCSHQFGIQARFHGADGFNLVFCWPRFKLTKFSSQVTLFLQLQCISRGPGAILLHATRIRMTASSDDSIILRLATDRWRLAKRRSHREHQAGVVVRTRNDGLAVLAERDIQHGLCVSVSELMHWRRSKHKHMSTHTPRDGHATAARTGHCGRPTACGNRHDRQAGWLTSHFT